MRRFTWDVGTSSLIRHMTVLGWCRSGPKSESRAGDRFHRFSRPSLAPTPPVTFLPGRIRGARGTKSTVGANADSVRGRPDCGRARRCTAAGLSHDRLPPRYRLRLPDGRRRQLSGCLRHCVRSRHRARRARQRLRAPLDRSLARRLGHRELLRQCRRGESPQWLVQLHARSGHAVHRHRHVRLHDHRRRRRLRLRHGFDRDRSSNAQRQLLDAVSDPVDRRGAGSHRERRRRRVRRQLRPHERTRWHRGDGRRRRIHIHARRGLLGRRQFPVHGERHRSRQPLQCDRATCRLVGGGTTTTTGSSTTTLPGATTTTTVPTTPPPPPKPQGYWMVGKTGAVYASARSRTTEARRLRAFPSRATPTAAAIGSSTPPDTCSRTATRSRTAVRAVYSRTSASRASRRVIRVTATGCSPIAGRVIACGDAKFYGDAHAKHLNGPIVGSVATSDGKGYYLVGSDGGIFTYGDAVFHGSMGNRRLNKPVNGLVPTKDGRGYWLVASDGGIFAFHVPVPRVDGW